MILANIFPVVPKNPCASTPQIVRRILSLIFPGLMSGPEQFKHFKPSTRAKSKVLNVSVSLGMAVAFHVTNVLPTTNQWHCIEDFIRFSRVDSESVALNKGLSKIGITHWTMFALTNIQELRYSKMRKSKAQSHQASP
ncbi:hypothetical protein VP01_1112g5 [Puccinia sorghi]|uniref:Uncharacterized protein n=1 Tax=Puccinia sorghi TaxID=27349 RepID=A0A0L6VSK6_9BASI|nr:hypothetical protein VP01_1112g5 [Puccinia sorghi]